MIREDIARFPAEAHGFSGGRKLGSYSLAVQTSFDRTCAGFFKFVVPERSERSEDPHHKFHKVHVAKQKRLYNLSRRESRDWRAISQVTRNEK